MKVVATEMVYYNNKRIQEGTEFFLKNEKDFSKKCMRKVEKGSKSSRKVDTKDPVEAVSDQDVI